jgi:hypothetical protein
MAAKDNVGEQFIDVFHRSHSSTPPHEADGEDYLLNSTGGSFEEYKHFKEFNPGGNLIFTGTRKAADDIHDSEKRPYLHKYQVPTSMVRPETFADDMSDTNVEPFRDWGDTTPGELWETTPVQTHLVTPDSVVGFRNLFEDFAKISHVIHKGSVTSGKIKYLGMEESKVNKKPLSRADKYLSDQFFPH